MGKCEYCGRSTFLFAPLCNKHKEMADRGELKQDLDGEWHLIKGKNIKYVKLPTSGFYKCVACDKKTNGYAFCKDCWNIYSEEDMLDILNDAYAENNEQEEENSKEETNNSLTCLICGQDSDGKHFCKECYKKYGLKTITATIKNCKKVEILDNYGNKNIRTTSGLYVRSQQEMIIYEELFRRNIRVEYERSIFIKDEKGQIVELHPDFYLLDYDLYIEHWGYENTQNTEYLKVKEYKTKLYALNGLKIAGTSKKDISNIRAAIDRIFAENDIHVN